MITSKPAHAGAPQTPLTPNARLLTEDLSPSLPSSSSPSLVCPALLFLLPPLQVALSVQGGGEGHVVEGSGDAIRPRVGRHAGNAVLCLVRRELPPQLLGRDVVLMETER